MLQDEEKYSLTASSVSHSGLPPSSPPSLTNFGNSNDQNEDEEDDVVIHFDASKEWPLVSSSSSPEFLLSSDNADTKHSSSLKTDEKLIPTAVINGVTETTTHQEAYFDPSQNSQSISPLIDSTPHISNSHEISDNVSENKIAFYDSKEDTHLCSNNSTDDNKIINKAEQTQSNADINENKGLDPLVNFKDAEDIFDKNSESSTHRSDTNSSDKSDQWGFPAYERDYKGMASFHSARQRKKTGVDTKVDIACPHVEALFERGNTSTDMDEVKRCLAEMRLWVRYCFGQMLYEQEKGDHMEALLKNIAAHRDKAEQQAYGDQVSKVKIEENLQKLSKEILRLTNERESFIYTKASLEANLTKEKEDNYIINKLSKEFEGDVTDLSKRCAFLQRSIESCELDLATTKVKLASLQADHTALLRVVRLYEGHIKLCQPAMYVDITDSVALQNLQLSDNLLGAPLTIHPMSQTPPASKGYTNGTQASASSPPTPSAQRGKVKKWGGLKSYVVKSGGGKNQNNEAQFMELDLERHHNRPSSQKDSISSVTQPDVPTIDSSKQRRWRGFGGFLAPGKHPKTSSSSVDFRQSSSKNLNAASVTVSGTPSNVFAQASSPPPPREALKLPEDVSSVASADE